MRIKIEGYIDSDDFEEPELFDPDHKSGLSEAGYEHFANGPLEFLSDVRFTKS